MYEVKASGLHLVWTYLFNSLWLGDAIKANCIKQTVLNCWSRYILNFNSSEKGLGLLSPLHFVRDFSSKTFLKLYSINWPNFIVWFSLLLEVPDNIYNVINYFPVFDAINFEIKLKFLIQSFPYTTKKVRTKT